MKFCLTDLVFFIDGKHFDFYCWNATDLYIKLFVVLLSFIWVKTYPVFVGDGGCGKCIVGNNFSFFFLTGIIIKNILDHIGDAITRVLILNSLFFYEIIKRIIIFSRMEMRKGRRRILICFCQWCHIRIKIFYMCMRVKITFVLQRDLPPFYRNQEIHRIPCWYWIPERIERNFAFWWWIFY